MILAMTSLKDAGSLFHLWQGKIYDLFLLRFVLNPDPSSMFSKNLTAHRYTDILISCIKRL